jgi:hypothetical protein
MSVYWKARLDGSEPCAICRRPRKDHWGRRNGLAPQHLSHQWRPTDTKPTEMAACPVCGHRLILHGSLLRDAWCIAWDGSTFCGCQTTVTPTVMHSEAAS